MNLILSNAKSPLWVCNSHPFYVPLIVSKIRPSWNWKFRSNVPKDLLIGQQIFTLKSIKVKKTENQGQDCQGCLLNVFFFITAMLAADRITSTT